MILLIVQSGLAIASDAPPLTSELTKQDVAALQGYWRNDRDNEVWHFSGDRLDRYLGWKKLPDVRFRIERRTHAKCIDLIPGNRTAGNEPDELSAVAKGLYSVFDDKLSSSFALFASGGSFLRNRTSLAHDAGRFSNHPRQARRPVMCLVTSFVVFLQPLAVVMTAPSFGNAMTLLAGWVFAPRRTVTGMIAAAGAVGQKHHSTFHRLFASARWSLDRAGLVVFDLMIALVGGLGLAGGRRHAGPQARVEDVRRRHAPRSVALQPRQSRSPTGVTVGSCWASILRFPLWPERAFCLPILFRLYLNKKSAARDRRVYRTRPELLVEMLTWLCQARKTRRFHLIADSAYGGQSVLNHLPANCDLTSRLADGRATLWAATCARAGPNGRPRKRGPQLPTPADDAPAACRTSRLDDLWPPGSSADVRRGRQRVRRTRSSVANCCGRAPAWAVARSKPFIRPHQSRRPSKC